MRKNNIQLVSISLALVLMLSSCSSTPKTPAELACEKASESVNFVNELATSTTDAVYPFPKIDVLMDALIEAKGKSKSDFGADFAVLMDYKDTFEQCLTPAALLLIQNSWKHEYELILTR